MIIKKHLIFSLLFVLGVCSGKAQKGSNQVTLIAESTVPIYQNDQGLGSFIKGSYGIGKSAQLTFTAGYSKFHSKNSVEIQKTTTRLIPFLAGYKQNINKFYVEPQIGFGELGGKISDHGDFANPSVGALFWALGAGYNIKQFVIGVRFQNAYAVEGSAAGLWHNLNFHYTAIHVGYTVLQRNN